MEKFKNRAAAPAHLRTKTELRAARLKTGLLADAWYWQGFHYVPLFDPANATPIRARSALTDKQKANLTAGRQLRGTVECEACHQRVLHTDIQRHGICTACFDTMRAEEHAQAWRSARAEAAKLLAASPLFLDTETTGLSDAAEIIEIAILDAQGAILLEQLVKPVGTVDEGARAVHGISDDELATAPDWPDVARDVSRLIEGRHVICHNAEFDVRMLKQSYARHGLPMPAATWDCTMALLTDINDGRWPRLMAASALVNAAVPTIKGIHHRAGYDAAVCREILVALGANDASTA
jgi:DNA polymerase III subunit epsilon